jgi:hypothetical protein
MMTFYSKTFADFAGTFKVPKRNLNAMPPVIQSSLQSKAFSKIFVPYFVEVPTRELYDRDNFETDQYSKMLYVESKMDRMIKRQKVADDRACQISKNIQRVTVSNRNKAKMQFESGEDNQDMDRMNNSRMSSYLKKKREEEKRRERRLSSYHTKKFSSKWKQWKPMDKLMSMTTSISSKRQGKFTRKKDAFVKFRITPVTMPVEI